MDSIVFIVVWKSGESGAFMGERVYFFIFIFSRVVF